MNTTEVIQLSYAEDSNLVGRMWLSHDGLVVVTARRTIGGLYYVRRECGREHPIAPASIRATLAESEVPALSVEEIAARSAAAMALGELD